MYSIRCLCGKIVCQVDNMPYFPRVEEGQHPQQDPAILILCRHCRRYVVLSIPTITGIHFSSNTGANGGQVFTTRS